MQSTFYQFTVKSLLAGVLIGLGCVIYVASPINYVGSFLFSLGLLTIMVKGLYLYTGKVGDWNVSSTFRLIYMFVLNGMACGATTYLFSLTRIDLSHIHDVVEHKLGDPSMLSSFILAIGCGAMMHIAYSGFNKGKHPLYVIMPVMFFMLAGFEHSVANCGFFAMAQVDMSLTDWTRLALIVLGNGVGSWVFTKFLHDPDAHGVPPCFGSDEELHHIKQSLTDHASGTLSSDKREVAKRI
ncbi:formate/nitrite transporter family protein [Anaerobiospirillum succiniciproducens]